MERFRLAAQYFPGEIECSVTVGFPDIAADDSLSSPLLAFEREEAIPAPDIEDFHSRHVLREVQDLDQEPVLGPAGSDDPRSQLDLVPPPVLRDSLADFFLSHVAIVSVQVVLGFPGFGDVPGMKFVKLRGINPDVLTGSGPDNQPAPDILQALAVIEDQPEDSCPDQDDPDRVYVQTGPVMIGHRECQDSSQSYQQACRCSVHEVIIPCATKRNPPLGIPRSAAEGDESLKIRTQENPERLRRQRKP